MNINPVSFKGMYNLFDKSYNNLKPEQLKYFEEHCEAIEQDSSNYCQRSGKILYTTLNYDEFGDKDGKTITDKFEEFELYEEVDFEVVG